MRLAVRRKNKPNESETKAVSSKCSSLLKAKLQRVIAGAAFVQLIILRFREWDISRFDLWHSFSTLRDSVKTKTNVFVWYKPYQYFVCLKSRHLREWFVESSKQFEFYLIENDENA